MMKNSTENRKGLRDAVAALLPPLSGTLYKGQCGKVAVIGGSRDYTGAPFYAAMSALHMGVDLAHVICTESAATPIKCYSPELIVHPLLPAADDLRGASEALLATMQQITQRFDSILVGPGLGLDEKVLSAVRYFFEHSKTNGIPLVVDADGLAVVTRDPSLVLGNKQCVLTPNAIEFERLLRSLLLPTIGDHEPVPSQGHRSPSCRSVSDLSDTPLSEMDRRKISAAVTVSRILGVTVLLKGAVDVVACNEEYWLSAERGSWRRSGGQGDVLSGCIAAALAWMRLKAKNSKPTESPVSLMPFTATASLCGAIVTRTASSIAFRTHHRGMTAAHMVKVVTQAFENAFPEFELPSQ